MGDRRLRPSEYPQGWNFEENLSRFNCELTILGKLDTSLQICESAKGIAENNFFYWRSNPWSFGSRKIKS